MSILLDCPFPGPFYRFLSGLCYSVAASRFSVLLVPSLDSRTHWTREQVIWSQVPWLNYLLSTIQCFPTFAVYIAKKSMSRFFICTCRRNKEKYASLSISLPKQKSSFVLVMGNYDLWYIFFSREKITDLIYYEDKKWIGFYHLLVTKSDWIQLSPVTVLYIFKEKVNQDWLEKKETYFPGKQNSN